MDAFSTHLTITDLSQSDWTTFKQGGEIIITRVSGIWDFNPV